MKVNRYNGLLNIGINFGNNYNVDFIYTFIYFCNFI